MIKKLLVVLVTVGLLIFAVQQQKTEEKSRNFQESYSSAIQVFEEAKKKQQSEVDSISSFFDMYNAKNFSGIYDGLMNDKIKQLKDRDMFINKLSELYNQLGAYYGGRQTGFGMGVKWILSNDKGEMLDEQVDLKISDVKWSAAFENGSYYFSFSFDKAEELSLYIITVKDSTIGGSMEQVL